MWGPAKIWPTFNLLKWWESWKSSQRNQCRSSSDHWWDFWDNWFVLESMSATINVEQWWLVHSPQQCPCSHGLECAAVFGKKHDSYPSSSPFTRPCAMRLFPIPSCERPDERETFCWCQQSEKENAGGLEQHQHWRVPDMFSAVGKKVGTSVSSQKESTFKETRFVIVQNLINHLKKIIPVIFGSPLVWAQ